MTEDFGFFKTEMPASRKADFYLGCLDGSVFIDFNISKEGQISLCRISFDGYGCCNLTESKKLLNFELSERFIEEIKKERIDQKKLAPIVKAIIKLNQEHIWTDALKEYNLIDRQE